MNIVDKTPEKVGKLITATAQNVVYRGVESGDLVLGLRVEKNDNTAYLANLRKGTIVWNGTDEGESGRQDPDAGVGRRNGGV